MDLDDIRKALEKKKPQTVEDAFDIVQSEINNLPDYAKKFNDMNLSRGNIIGTAIKVEGVLNEIISKTDCPDMAKSTLRKKVGFIKRILRRINSQELVVKKFYDNLDKFVRIRGLYAHVPEDIFSTELSFAQDKNYERFFEGIDTKSVKELNKEFLEICNLLSTEYLNIMSLIKNHLDRENPIKTR